LIHTRIVCGPVHAHFSFVHTIFFFKRH
jgi:hypothetical protein